ncbi:MAG: hypothetical protein HC904_09525 [Blastochloris sp.]|nr:hypothetical protein [Blastochloris sp.]
MHVILLLLALPLLPSAWTLTQHGWLAPAPQLKSGISESELQKKYSQLFWIDARENPRPLSGTRSGALPLHEKNWDTQLPLLFQAWDGQTPLVVFCDPGCDNSRRVARKLRELGLDPVLELAP